MTKIVNINLGESYDVYVGRAGQGKDGYFGNPFTGYSRKQSIDLFREYFYRRIAIDSEYKSKILELKDKKLGCFCRPVNGFRGNIRCHAQVIVSYLDGIREGEIR